MSFTGGVLPLLRCAYLVNRKPLFHHRKVANNRHKIPVQINGSSSSIARLQEIANRTHFSRTPKKPEYLIARSQLTERGPLGFGPNINF